MVTKRYAHILDEDRRRLADEMEQSFYKSKTEETPDTAAPALDAEALASLLASNPELLKRLWSLSSLLITPDFISREQISKTHRISKRAENRMKIPSIMRCVLAKC